MLEVRHRIPGRLRLMIPDLRCVDATASQAIFQALRACPEVEHARINPACGSLVVEFSAASDPDAIIIHLRELLADRPWHGAAAAVPPLHLASAPQATAGVLHTPAPGSRHAPRARVSETLSTWVARLAPRPRINPPDQPSWICRLNLRLTRWMLRTSLRALWHEQTSTTASPGAPGDHQPPLGFAWLYRLSEPLLKSPTHRTTS
ncbi:hypothetical protein CKO25_13445 [Thiocapsa imhoffii]|uniref:Uncharacterized protein n=1 Tax=Thiocapsa imhoffii TaxID=382777 RepID=A0A9X1B9A2_9GAMM|nr:hypothetical protein [Thiocapsa imhoffii]MBK1645632.1 hypothetical protein [Thiocapsa imhoffii]